MNSEEYKICFANFGVGVAALGDPCYNGINNTIKFIIPDFQS